jgi:hypothetical protein
MSSSQLWFASPACLSSKLKTAGKYRRRAKFMCRCSPTREELWLTAAAIPVAIVVWLIWPTSLLRAVMHQCARFRERLTLAVMALPFVLFLWLLWPLAAIAPIAWFGSAFGASLLAPRGTVFRCRCSHAAAYCLLTCCLASLNWLLAQLFPPEAVGAGVTWDAMLHAVVFCLCSAATFAVVSAIAWSHFFKL